MGRKMMSRPIPGVPDNDLLSNYVFYEDKSPVGLVGGAAHTYAGQPMRHMTGVTFADRAKYEILQLRSEIEFLQKDNEKWEEKYRKLFEVAFHLGRW